MELKQMAAHRRPALLFCLGVSAFAVLGSACGDDNSSSPATATSPVQDATNAPTAIGTVPATLAIIPAQEITNALGVKLGVVKKLEPGDAAKLTLPSTADKIDKLDISDAFAAGNTVLRVGITDGIVLSPADVKVAKIEKLKDTAVGAESFKITLTLADSRALLVWVAPDAVFQMKEGDSVPRGSALLTAPTRLSGPAGDGYTMIVEMAGGPTLGLRTNLGPGPIWVGARPAVVAP